MYVLGTTTRAWKWLLCGGTGAFRDQHIRAASDGRLQAALVAADMKVVTCWHQCSPAWRHSFTDA